MAKGVIIANMDLVVGTPAEILGALSYFFKPVESKTAETLVDEYSPDVYPTITNMFRVSANPNWPTNDSELKLEGTSPSFMVGEDNLPSLDWLSKVFLPPVAPDYRAIFTESTNEQVFAKLYAVLQTEVNADWFDSIALFFCGYVLPDATPFLVYMDEHVEGEQGYTYTWTASAKHGLVKARLEGSKVEMGMLTDAADVVYTRISSDLELGEQIGVMESAVEHQKAYMGLINHFVTEFDTKLDAIIRDCLVGMGDSDAKDAQRLHTCANKILIEYLDRVFVADNDLPDNQDLEADEGVSTRIGDYIDSSRVMYFELIAYQAITRLSQLPQWSWIPDQRSFGNISKLICISNNFNQLFHNADATFLNLMQERLDVVLQLGY